MTIAVALCCVVFTGCNKDKDQTYTYGIGFELEGSSWSGDASVFEEWVNSIFSAYETALGVTESTFTKTGKEADCDFAVRDACKKAEPVIDNIEHKGSGTLSVTNETTHKVVYSYHITRATAK